VDETSHFFSKSWAKVVLELLVLELLVLVELPEEGVVSLFLQETKIKIKKIIERYFFMVKGF